RNSTPRPAGDQAGLTSESAGVSVRRRLTSPSTALTHMSSGPGLSGFDQENATKLPSGGHAGGPSLPGGELSGKTLNCGVGPRSPSQITAAIIKAITTTPTTIHSRRDLAGVSIRETAGKRSKRVCALRVNAPQKPPRLSGT